MIRGGAYSAIMHLMVLGLILFGLPSLAFLLPEWQKHESAVPVVVMSKKDADALNKAAKPPRQTPPAKPESTSRDSRERKPERETQQHADNKPLFRDSTKTSPKPSDPSRTSIPIPSERHSGGFSVVKDPDPFSKSTDEKTTTRSPASKNEKPAPVTGTGSDTTRARAKFVSDKAPSLAKARAEGAISLKSESPPLRPAPSSLFGRHGEPPGAPSPSQGQTTTRTKAPEPAENGTNPRSRDATASSPRRAAGMTTSLIPSTANGDTQIARNGVADSAQAPNDPITALMAQLAAKVPRLKNLRDRLEHPQSEKLTASMVRSANRMKKLSNEGYSHAQFSLAEMYLTGTGVRRDDKKAVNLLDRAAMSGYLPAQLTLGMLAAEGKAMERNLAEAHTWLAVAAEQGNKAATAVLPKLEKLMSVRDTVESRKQSYRLHKILVIIHGSDLKKLSKTELSKRLRVAAALGDVESVFVLLAQGADADGADLDGRTALIEASWRGYARIVKSLIDAGADLRAVDNTKKNAVMWAAINGHAPIIAELVAAGAPINDQDNEGITALMRAAWNSHPKAVEVLLKAGAKVNIRDKKGRTALDYAVMSGNAEVRKILQAAARRQ